MNVIDLFSGAGGLTEGFLKEGYNIVAHVEKEKWACETLKTRVCYYYLKSQNDLDLYYNYLLNSTNYRTLEQDRNIIFNKYPELKQILEKEVLNRTFGNPANDPASTSSKDIIRLIEESMRFNNVNDASIIIGGPPCQAYSLVGRARMKENVNKDKRNFLFYYYKEIVDYFRPNLFIFENVPGILNAQNGKVFPKIKEEFDKIGYTLVSGVNEDDRQNIHDSNDFGVYQSRKRVILFGYRNELNLTYPNFYNYAYQFDEASSTLNAIGDINPIKPGEGDDFAVAGYHNAVLSNYQKLMRQDSIGIMQHKARPINKEYDKLIYREAIQKASQGIQLQYSDLPAELKMHNNETSFQDRFKVHWWDDVPHTIVAHISKDGHYNIHPDITQCRSLTVREAARIQSFPDNYRFEGPRTSQFMQIGNAVPPLMSHAIARTIKNEILNNI